MPLETSSGPSALGSLAASPSSLGSLSQAARGKQLKTARWIMIVVGILTVVINGVVFATIPAQVDAEIKKQVDDLHRRGQIEQQASVDEFRRRVTTITQLIVGAAIAVGVVFIVLGTLVKKYPVPATVLGLVLYVGCAAIFGYLDPTTLVSGLLVKIIIVVALVKAIQSAVAYQRDATAPA
jgi:hypothetical protein